jgi:CheY-like chemotaxis protein
MPALTSTGTTFEGRSGMSTTLHPAVWIVEDDLDDRVLLNEAFLDTKMPCSLTLYPDAITALQTLGISVMDELPDIIVSDYNMPYMNGLEFIESLCVHKRYDAVIKIILSTSAYLFDKEACLQSGANAYFIKPPNYTGLIDVAFSILTLYK